jgi:hypothetical protein
MADLTPEQKSAELVNQIEIKFGSLQTFYGWMDVAVLTMNRSKLETELGSIKDQQQSSRQTLEVSIQAKQTEFNAFIAQMRIDQQSDYDQWQTQVTAKQTQLDTVIAQLKSLMGDAA